MHKSSTPDLYVSFSRFDSFLMDQLRLFINLVVSSFREAGHPVGRLRYKVGSLILISGLTICTVSPDSIRRNILMICSEVCRFLFGVSGSIFNTQSLIPNGQVLVRQVRTQHYMLNLN
jgi:hypothetical protein